MGSGDPHNVEFIFGLARARKALDRPAEAETRLKRAIATQERATAATLLSLADLYRERNGSEAAEWLLERALAIFEQSLGTADPTTVSCLQALHAVRTRKADAGRLRSWYSDVQEPDVETLRLRRPATGDTNPFTEPEPPNPFADTQRVPAMGPTAKLMEEAAGPEPEPFEVSDEQ